MTRETTKRSSMLEVAGKLPVHPAQKVRALIDFWLRFVDTKTISLPDFFFQLLV
jgi:hypothetical protein